MIVKLKITNGAGFHSYKDIEVKEESTIAKTERKAQLQFLNQYINRDGHIATSYTSISEAKKRAGIKVSVIN